jgi:hypothetical protein
MNIVQDLRNIFNSSRKQPYDLTFKKFVYALINNIYLFK